VDLRGLARDALSGPEVDVASHSLPEETGRKEASGSPNTRMTKGVNMVENLLSEFLWNERAESGGGNIAEELKSGGKGNGGNLEGRKSLEERNSRTFLLFLSNF
jgi:hypothetical protein